MIIDWIRLQFKNIDSWSWCCCGCCYVRIKVKFNKGQFKIPICLRSASVDPSSGCCTLAYSYCLGVPRNFCDWPPVVVATYIVVALAFVVRALASGTDPFDVFVASFA